MMNTQQAIEAEHAVKYPTMYKGKDPEDHRVDKALYRAAQNEIYQQFRTWLATEYSYTMPEAADNLIWNKAWEDGHHAGLAEVENKYIDYAEFAQSIADALK